MPHERYLPWKVSQTNKTREVDLMNADFDSVKLLRAVREGYGGVLPNGNLVDRRVSAEAIPIQENPYLRVPGPKGIDSPTPSDLETMRALCNHATTQNITIEQAVCDHVAEGYERPLLEDKEIVQLSRETAIGQFRLYMCCKEED